MLTLYHEANALITLPDLLDRQTLGRLLLLLLLKLHAHRHVLQPVSARLPRHRRTLGRAQREALIGLLHCTRSRRRGCRVAIIGQVVQQRKHVDVLVLELGTTRPAHAQYVPEMLLEHLRVAQPLLWRQCVLVVSLRSSWMQASLMSRRRHYCRSGATAS